MKVAAGVEELPRDPCQRTSLQLTGQFTGNCSGSFEAAVSFRVQESILYMLLYLVSLPMLRPQIVSPASQASSDHPDEGSSPSPDNS